MQNRFLVLAIMWMPMSSWAQIQQAYVSEDYRIHIESTNQQVDLLDFRNETILQMDGFPKRATGNKAFKNFRNVTLADINNDGIEDILWGADDQLFAQTATELLWEKTLSGVAIYPPSVADLDQDGDLEIVQATGGTQSEGRLYAIDHLGNDLSGWPLNFDGHWILTAPAISDMDEDGNLEIIFNERDLPQSKLHIVKWNGAPIANNWPVGVDGTLALTPSIGDVDNDGRKEIYVATTTTRYLFDLKGTPEPGWPQLTDPIQRYSFQSALLADFNQDNLLEIVGATHGEDPYYYVLQADGAFFPGWPIDVPEDSWTFNTPTITTMNDGHQLFMSRPINEDSLDMLYGWEPNGMAVGSFPLSKSGGLEGLISIADIDNDDAFELVFGSNQLFPDGYGLIHAYELDGLTEVPGFPLRPRGWTFMNGVNIGDVNGDGLMDLVALTYTQSTNTNVVDSVYLNVFELRTPYTKERVLWGTYKGDNTRAGLVKSAAQTTATSLSNQLPNDDFVLHTTVVSNDLTLTVRSSAAEPFDVSIFNTQGQLWRSVEVLPTDFGRLITISLPELWPSGLYFVRGGHGHSWSIKRFVKP